MRAFTTFCVLGTCFAASMLLVLCSCGSKQPETPAAAQEPESPLRDSFSLSILPETFSADPSGERADAEFSISVTENGDRLRVDIKADSAKSLKALYYELTYDAKICSPAVALATSSFAPTDRQLVLSHFSVPGVVHGGQVMLQPQEAEGFSGSAVLASVEFRLTPFNGAVRSASEAPTSEASRTTLELDSDAQLLSWLYFSSGDYSQNFETNIGDLTPIGQHFNVSAAPEPLFALEDVKSVVDGDGNGLINITDLTPIGANFLNRVLSYNIYASGNFDNVPQGSADASTIEPIGFVNAEDAAGDPAAERLTFSFQLAELTDGWFYWVRPCDGLDGEGNEGTVSTLVSSGSNPDNIAPVASFTADPLSGDAPLTVNFDASASADSDGSIVQFAWDFDGNGSIDKTSTTATAQHEYAGAGIFAAALTVTDNGASVDNATRQIQVSSAGNNAPAADIAASTQLGEPPLQVSFDASASSDSDGSIVQFEWDFEGDGIFDANTGSIPEAIRTYNQFGSFSPTVRVTDDGALTDTAAVDIEVQNVNLLPLAVIEASETEFDIFGPDVITTFDASLSSDTDGEIVSYRWDFNGDGVIDHDSGQLSTVEHEYTAAGIFDATVHIRDNEGGTASASVQIKVTDGGGIRPRAMLTASPFFGDAPLEVQLDASASFDPDGSIVKYEWNLNGDFSFELDTGSESTTSTVLLGANSLNFIEVRVTDDTGRTTVAGVVVATGDSNLSPIARLVASPSSGVVPLVVELDASSSLDNDGSISKFEWDLDDDNIFELDSGLLAQQQLTLENEQSLLVTVRVTDDEGAQSTATALLSALDPGNQPPIAALTADSGNGTAPFEITLDASGSTDSDGDISSYSWDINNDGSFDFKDNPNPTLTITCSQSGTHTALVQVKDNDQATDTATFGYTVTGGWSSSIIQQNVRLENLGNDLQAIAGIVSGKGASARANLAYVDTSKNPDVLTYVKATDQTGSSWLSPVEVVQNAQANEGLAINILTGEPAILYSRTFDLDFLSIKATDANGLNWGNPVLIDSVNSSGHNPALTTVGQIPLAIGGINSFQAYKATSTEAAGWNAPQLVNNDNPANDHNVVVLQLGGRPALFYAGQDVGPTRYRLALATDETASDWNDPVTLPFADLSRKHIGAAIVNGRPAICAIENAGETNQISYVRAEDSLGLLWPESVTTVYAAFSFDVEEPLTLVLFDGLPAIGFKSFARPQSLMLSQAGDQDGTVWGPAQLVAMGDLRDGIMLIAGGEPLIIATTATVNQNRDLLCFHKD